MTALYLKYRSAVLGELIGQDHIVRTLGNELRLGKLAHAYLLAGIRGTGKTSTARILARAVNCLQPQDGEPCNRCAACLEILEGSAVDVLEIDAASNRGIDEMRDLRERVRYLPARLRTKVYIIDEAHMLTTEAWNAFLKTLEEPPGHVLFVLCTTEPHKVPETVRSRVQRFDFGRVAATGIEAHLAAIVAAEGMEADPAALRTIALAAQGSVRDALSLLDQCFAMGERPVTVAGCRRALGLADPAVVRDLLEGLAERDAAAALRAAAAAFEAGADPRQLLRECSRLARAAELHAVGYSEGTGLDAEEDELCRRLATRQPDGHWLRVLEQMGATALELRQPVDARLQVEACLLRLCRPADPADVAGLAARLASLERRLGAGPGAEREARPAAAADERAAPGALPETPAPRVPGTAGQPPPSGVVSRPAPASSAPAAIAGPPASAAVGRPAPAPSAPAATAAPLVPAVPSQPSSSRAAGSTSALSGGPLDTPEAWQRAWPSLIEAVNQRDRVFAGVLRGCRPLEADPERLVIGAPFGFHLAQLRNKDKAPMLAEVVRTLAGGSRAVTAELSKTRQAEAEGAAGDAGPSLTDEVLSTFTGSRVTATRLQERSREPAGETGSAPAG
ncbi:MAG TPA: DNA polymerase III subunit gamma/tau [Candidatus Binatia bacterium]|nr:DNA polymerase III subunit gamma/tau [Candidatus Binatia bacterium]